jgi:hypothetical protein
MVLINISFQLRQNSLQGCTYWQWCYPWVELPKGFGLPRVDVLSSSWKNEQNYFNVMILYTIICHNSFTKHLSLIEILSGMAVLEIIIHRLPAHLTRTMSASAIPSSIKLWHELPRNVKEVRSRNSFKFTVRVHLGGKKNPLVSTKLNLERQTEIVLNKARCDLIFRAHLFSHNVSNVPDPSCRCGFRAQTTLRCPLFNQARYLAFDNIINIPSFDGHDMCLSSNQEDKFHLL